MTTYAQSGVNVSEGDRSSMAAYEAAKGTFFVREGKMGSAVVLDEGFTGLLDFGDYYMVQNDDGVGSKSDVAFRMQKYDTLGYDLLAMVADDAVCVGAETVSVSDTIDVEKVSYPMIKELMEGLKKACIEQKVVIPGGEIAEMGSLTKGFTWNATAVGIVEKDKCIFADGIVPGQVVIGLLSAGIRSNGTSLARYILTNKFGENWVKEPFGDGRSWGEVILTPSRIFHHAVLEVIGRFKEPRKAKLYGIAHITGGGLGNNFNRLLRKNKCGADLNNVPVPHSFMLKMQEFGQVADREAYLTWNMGVGMVVVVDKKDVDLVQKILGENKIPTTVIGTVTSTPGVRITSKGFQNAGSVIEFA